MCLLTAFERVSASTEQAQGHTRKNSADSTIYCGGIQPLKTAAGGQQSGSRRDKPGSGPDKHHYCLDSLWLLRRGQNPKPEAQTKRMRSEWLGVNPHGKDKGCTSLYLQAVWAGKK